MEGFLQLVSYLLKIQFSLVQLECALRTYLQKIGAAPIRPLTMTTGEERTLQALPSILALEKQPPHFFKMTGIFEAAGIEACRIPLSGSVS